MATKMSQAATTCCEVEPERHFNENTQIKLIDSSVIQEVTIRVPEIISELPHSTEPSSSSQAPFQHLSGAVNDLEQRILSLPSFEVSSLQKQVKSMHVVLKPLTREEATAMFRQFHEKSLVTTDVAEIVSKVAKHGWTALSESFTELYEGQCSLSMTRLLEQLWPHCSTPENRGISVFASASASATAVQQVPQAAWIDLLRRFVSRIQQSTTPSSRAYSTYFAFSDVHVNDEWLTVGRFVATHCSVQAQQTVATHLGDVLSLYALNYLITHLPADGVPDGPLQERLRHCAVQQCVRLAPLLCDVKTVVEWVVRGHYVELLPALSPVLQASAELIVEPAVRQELARESLMSYELRRVVHARIDSLQKLTVVPPLCWRLPPDHLHCTIPAVCAFLDSEEQSVEITYRRFGSRKDAKRWAKAFRSRYVSAIAEQEVVNITKNASTHQAAVKRCAECKKEILTLRKLLNPSSRSTSSVDVDNCSDSSVESGTVRKKAKSDI